VTLDCFEDVSFVTPSSLSKYAETKSILLMASKRIDERKIKREREREKKKKNNQKNQRKDKTKHVIRSGVFLFFLADVIQFVQQSFCFLFS